MRATRALIGLLIVSGLLAGCSAYMASQRSVYRGDPKVIQVGTERAAVEAALGPPELAVPLEDSRTKAVYKLDPDAHPRLARNAAIAGHVVADLLTWGLWEIVGTPLELAVRDKFVTYLVNYGPDGKIETFERIR